MSPPLIRIEGGATGYSEDKPIISRMNLRIDGDDRIGLLGRNGSGKSTLAKLLTDQIALMDGSLKKHKKLAIAHFAQHQIDALHPKTSAYDHVIELMPDATEAQRRARLARFGLPQDRQETPAENLSGGEKARLLMNLISFHGAHFLILDEPTNHLDMDSRAALIDAINAYEGAVLIISHDRYLLESCVDRLWLCAKGTIEPYTEDMEAYRRFLLKGEEDNAKSLAKAKPDERAERRRSAAEKRAALKPLKAKAAKWEKEIERLKGILATIDKGLAVPGLWEKDPNTATELNKKRARAEELLEQAEESWLEVAEALEAAEAED